MTSDSSIKSNIEGVILREFLPGESEKALTDETELITHGVLGLTLVTFVEGEYAVRIAAHEVSTDNLNKLVDIERLIASKL